MSREFQTTDGRYDIQALIDLMARLRDATTGCPWDCAQDFTTIAAYTVEEAYEVADAIARGDLGDLADELGDLLFQVVFHARMAEELGHFSFLDVVHAIVDKMVRRHPHVFAADTAGAGNGEPADSTERRLLAARLNHSWESMKAVERRDKGLTSAMDDIPRGLAPLQRSRKLQKRAAAQGFDWHSVPPVMDKLQEELHELEQARAIEQAYKRRTALQHELGDVLFTCVNLARKLELDPEIALLDANTRFETRFRAMEEAAERRGTLLAAMDDKTRELLWESVKRRE